MALKKYIGARYTPKFMGAWDAQTVYAALSVVYANEQSYVSRKTVPAGTELTNTEYWVKSADWNAQVTEYSRNVENYNRNVEEYNKNVVAYEQAVNTFYADTLHSYDNKAAMVADQDLRLGDTVLTCGDKTIGDNGGSFYQVVAETSAKAVALENGLYALPIDVNVGTLAGNVLSFTGKSEAAGIWNVVAPASLTIPLTVPQSGTAMTYLAVLYTSTSASVTANVTVNGVSKTLTFTDKADSGYEKFVVYAITCKNTDQLYWSQTAVSSWQTIYKTAGIEYNTKIGANAPAVFINYDDKNIGGGRLPINTIMNFTVTKTIKLNSITINLPTFKNENTELGDGYITLSEYPNANYTGFNYDELVLITDIHSNTTAGNKTYALSATLQPKHYYQIKIFLPDKPAKTIAAQNGAASGTFDFIKIEKTAAPDAQNFNGVLNYQTVV